MSATHIHMIFETGVRAGRLAPSLHLMCPDLAGLEGLALVEAVRAAHPGVSWSCGPLPVPEVGLVPAEVLGALAGYPLCVGMTEEVPDPAGVEMLRCLTGGVPGAMPEGAVEIVALGQEVRLLLCSPVAAGARDLVARISFEIDDMTGEEIAHATAWLRRTLGVIDLVLSQGQGKKDRPVTRFDLLADPQRLGAVGDAVFLQTTTLGFREEIVQRRLLERWPEVAGGQRRKRARRPGGGETVKVEADDLAELPTLQARRAAARR
ncbi:nickel insertion protein [Pseudooceanicola sp. C21-150M6]|uniref:nickel insertion protein n=1 Tax=Pseudooceanicola sp. C21-150M6 TaxID=3434355 RepID=UPI003D7F235B